MAEKLRLSKEECADLTAICTKLLDKQTYIVSGKKEDNSDVAMMLAKELKDNEKEPASVIQKYYKICGLEEKNKNSSNPKTEGSKKIEPAKPQVSEKTSNAKTAGADNTGGIGTKSPVEGKTKPIGQTTSNTAAQSGPKTPHIDACTISVVEYTFDPTKLHEQGQRVVLIDPKSNLYSYYDPSAYDQLDIYKVLKDMQRRFEAAVYNNKKNTEKVSWLATEGTAYKVNDNAVENCIRGLKGESACENLKPEDATEVAYVINNDQRFGKYFKLHAAIRLIDRFANLDDPGMPLEEQCHRILDCFENTVRRAFSERINIKLYVDEKSGDFGERISISPLSYYDEDKKYFKNKPLIFGLGKLVAPSMSNRPPVIVTIFNE